MHISGIICEYNPLHLGHQKQLSRIRDQHPDGAVVCLMSGNFVQRGMPAIFDKTLRAKAAVQCGADLVLELPVTACLSSAEGFADTGVSILGKFCNSLSFGAEHNDKDGLLRTAEALLHPDFPDALRHHLNEGLSFPAARQKALEAMGVNSTLVCSPNDILAVEYCKAILSQGVSLIPEPILREGNYHDTTADFENPSATAVRSKIEAGESWEQFVPTAAQDFFAGAPIHTLQAGQRAILAVLRTMDEADFETLPHGSEGLWRKLMHSVREQATLEEIFTAVKSKRYTRTRLNRMVLCAYLGITQKDMQASAPYVRVLAFNDKGRQVLKQARKTGTFINIGEVQDHPYQLLENRIADLYGLFSQETPEAPGSAESSRVYYHTL